MVTRTVVLFLITFKVFYFSISRSASHYKLNSCVGHSLYPPESYPDTIYQKNFFNLSELQELASGSIKKFKKEIFKRNYEQKGENSEKVTCIAKMITDTVTIEKYKTNSKFLIVYFKSSDFYKLIADSLLKFGYELIKNVNHTNNEQFGSTNVYSNLKFTLSLTHIRKLSKQKFYKIFISKK